MSLLLSAELPVPARTIHPIKARYYNRRCFRNFLSHVRQHTYIAGEYFGYWKISYPNRPATEALRNTNNNCCSSLYEIYTKTFIFYSNWHFYKTLEYSPELEFKNRMVNAISIKTFMLSYFVYKYRTLFIFVVWSNQTFAASIWMRNVCKYVSQPVAFQAPFTFWLVRVQVKLYTI